MVFMPLTLTSALIYSRLEPVLVREPPFFIERIACMRYDVCSMCNGAQYVIYLEVCALMV